MTPVTADQVTSAMLPGTYYTVKLSALDDSKSVNARCQFGTGAKSLTWTSWVEDPS